jgi:segregation and condensation protein A
MYRVNLDNFEGPLDLLLFFIRRDELNVYDIPIAYITDQFLGYIHYLEELDLSVASEFILMASTLMAIKARMMIPRTLEEMMEDPELDPRQDLVQRLLEYKRYKEMSEEMNMIDYRVRERYFRENTAVDLVDAPVSDGESLKNISIFDLIAAFRKVMMEVRTEPVHKVEREETTIEEMGQFVVDWIRVHGRTSFIDIVSRMKSKVRIVTTFLAVLELIREQVVLLFEDDRADQFYIEYNPNQPTN